MLPSELTDRELLEFVPVAFSALDLLFAALHDSRLLAQGCFPRHEFVLFVGAQIHNSLDRFLWWWR